MFSKLIADKNIAFADITDHSVLLKDNLGKVFRGRIVPVLSIPKDIIEAIPDDEYILDYKGALRAVKGFSGVPHQDDHYAEAFKLLSSGHAVYYAIIGPQEVALTPDTIYGYVGFEREDVVGCLRLCQLYSRNYYTDIPEKQIFNFGRSMLRYGHLLQDSIYSQDTRNVLYADSIRSEAKDFYKAMGFKRPGLFRRSRVLRRRHANKLLEG